MEYKSNTSLISPFEYEFTHFLPNLVRSERWEKVKTSRFFKEYFLKSQIDTPHIPNFREMFCSPFPGFVVEQFRKFIISEQKKTSYFDMYFKSRNETLDFVLESLGILTEYSEQVPGLLYSNELIRALCVVLKRNKKQYRDEIFQVLNNLAKNSFASFKALMDNDILNFMVEFIRSCNDETLISMSIYLLSNLCSFNIGNTCFEFLFNLFVEYRRYSITLYGFAKLSKWCQHLFINTEAIIFVFNSILDECTQFNNSCFVCLYNCCLSQIELLPNLLEHGLINKIDHQIKISNTTDIGIQIDFLILISENTYACNEYICSILQDLMVFCEKNYKIKIHFLLLVSTLLRNGGYQIMEHIEKIGVIPFLCESIDYSNVKLAITFLESLVNYFKIVGTEMEDFQVFKDVLLSLENESELIEHVRNIKLLFNICE